jgi:hypothetical protein
MELLNGCCWSTKAAGRYVMISGPKWNTEVVYNNATTTLFLIAYPASTEDMIRFILHARAMSSSSNAERIAKIIARCGLKASRSKSNIYILVSLSYRKCLIKLLIVVTNAALMNESLLYRRCRETHF